MEFSQAYSFTELVNSKVNHVMLLHCVLENCKVKDCDLSFCTLRNCEVVRCSTSGCKIVMSKIKGENKVHEKVIKGTKGNILMSLARGVAKAEVGMISWVSRSISSVW